MVRLAVSESMVESESTSAVGERGDAEIGGVDRRRDAGRGLGLDRRWSMVPVSLKVSFSLSPRSRLMPLNEASSANLSSWSFRSLNWVTRLLRTSLPLIVSVLAAAVDGIRGSARAGHGEVGRREVLDAQLAAVVRRADLAGQGGAAVDRGDELIHGLHRAGDAGSVVGRRAQTEGGQKRAGGAGEVDVAVGVADRDRAARDRRRDAGDACRIDRRLDAGGSRVVGNGHVGAIDRQRAAGIGARDRARGRAARRRGNVGDVQGDVDGVEPTAPPVNERFLTEAVPIVVESIV